jgi:hypothetical protein
MSGSARVKEHIPWLIEQEISDSVSFALFVQKFGFMDLEDAKSVYEKLIGASFLRVERRRALLAKYNGFLRNNLQSFWSSHLLKMEKRETKTNLEIAVTKSARVVQTASVREIAITAKLLEDGGGDQYESVCGLKSKRKIEGNIDHHCYPRSSPLVAHCCCKTCSNAMSLAFFFPGVEWSRWPFEGEQEAGKDNERH